MRVNLNYHDVEKLFEDSEKEPILELYRLVFPDFDKMEKIDGWPTINRETSNKISGLYLAKKAKMERDIEEFIKEASEFKEDFLRLWGLSKQV